MNINYLEAINHRKAVRNYDKTPIDSERFNIIKNLIDEKNKEYNLSIAFRDDGSRAFLTNSHGLFVGVKSVIVMKGFKGDVNLKEKLGYVGEQITLTAVSLGLGLCWVGGTFDREDPAFKTEENEEFVCVITIGIPAKKETLKQRLAHLVMRKKSAKKFYTSDTKSLPYWFKGAISAVRKAPSAKNTQKVHFDYKNGGVTASVPDTYRFDLVDLGIAKFHFDVIAHGHFTFGNGGDFTKD